MKVLVIQHSAADSPGTASQWLESHGLDVQTVRIDRNDPIPLRVDADVLMTFGGAISLTTSRLPDWVAAEQALIRKYVDQHRRVLGICLGSQMVANALGARVTRNPEPEIGWHTIEPVTEQGTSGAADLFAPRLTVLQWHCDTFEIPPGATRLLRSQACERQGYSIDDRVFGFQFHIEASARTVDIFLRVSDKWKLSRPFVQSESEIEQGKQLYLANQTAVFDRFLERFLS